MSSNVYQNYFIPEKSVWVRFLVHKAGEYALVDDFLYRRVASVVCAVVAVIFSFFNAVSYLLQVPLKLLLNIVRYDLVSLVLDPGKDLSNCLRSLLFATFGVNFVILGILLPNTIFPYFAPPAKRDLAKENQVLLTKLNAAQQANLELEREKDDLQEKLEQKQQEPEISLPDLVPEVLTQPI